MDKKDTKEEVVGGGETPMQALTDDQVEEIREVLAKYETDGVGMISQIDVCEALYSLGMYRTEAEVTQMFAEFELEIGEYISEEQFLSVMTKAYQQLYDKESLKAAFDTFDEDGSEFISASELQNATLALGAKYTDTELEEMFREVDFDNDGKIGWNDFIRAVTKP